ncbi:MAG: EAL domain-containing protein, partial [Firmicutes bacterium]|nr:EAL domain-containing protein [Candidatus Caballimonas caccae]
IIDFEHGFPVAYRTEMLIHSILLGEMPENSYTYVSDYRDCGVELFKRTILHIIRAVEKFNHKGRNIKFLSMRCPAELVEKIDFYETLKEILMENQTFNPEQLCLEFPASILSKNEEKAKTAILDTKALKIKTSIIGCGEKEFPLSKLVEVTPDMVVLDKSATMYAGDRNKPQLLASMVSYIKSMGIDAIAEGEESSRKLMRSTECIGFTVTNADSLSFKEALEQKEEE